VDVMVGLVRLRVGGGRQLPVERRQPDPPAATSRSVSILFFIPRYSRGVHMTYDLGS
jgi:hypothetical protein